jgi:DNA-binding transcriptional ArsR family regulator
VDDNGSSGPQMVERNDWLRTLERLKMPVTRKAVAMYCAWKGNQDGSSITVGEKRIANVFDLDVSTVRGHLAALRAMGLLHRTRRGSGRGRAAEGGTYASTHYLSLPRDVSTLPWRLDPDMRRGDQPLTRLPDDENTGTWGAVIGLVHRAQTLGDTAPDPVENVDHRVQAPGDRAPEPVDNRNHREPAPGSGGLSPRADEPITANLTANHRELDRLSPLAGTRQPSRYQPATIPSTNRGHATRVRHVAREADRAHPDSSPPPQHARTAAAVTALPAPPTVSEAEYADAYHLLAQLPDGGQFLLARAIAEYCDEGFRDVPATVLAVRAAQIASRHTPRSA